MRKPDSGFVAGPWWFMPMTALTLVSLMIVGCATKSQGVSSDIFDVFEGFTFVGTSADQAETSEASHDADALAAHGDAQLPSPRVQEIGIRYVFHHRRPVDNERLALVDFPARLKAAGIRVVYAPKSSRDLMYPFVGGPTFVIGIAYRGHEGRIYNGLCPNSLRSTGAERAWADDDYILLWSK